MTTMTASDLVSRPRLFSPALILVMAADIGGLTSFYLLLSVVPQYATSVGVTSTGAGLTTAALMLSTVAVELLLPRLTARLGYRTVLAAGLILLGAPALVLPLTADIVAITAVCLVRGMGLAVIFVVCGELCAKLVPAQRRGEGLGVMGVAAGLPAIVAMPAGVWLAENVGFAVVFVIAALSSLAGLAAIPALRGHLPAICEPLGMFAGLRRPGMLRPVLTFGLTAMAAGAVVTFLPMMSSHGGSLIAVALLAHSVAATGARWWAGRAADKRGAARLLTPAVLLCAAGLGLLFRIDSPTALLLGMVVFGLGFGMVQNISMVMMYDRVGDGGYGTVTAWWSVAYDAGLGAGAACFGLLLAWV